MPFVASKPPSPRADDIVAAYNLATSHSSPSCVDGVPSGGYRKLRRGPLRTIRPTLVSFFLLGLLSCKPKSGAAPADAHAQKLTSPAQASMRTPAEIAASSTPSVVSVRTEQSL